MEATSGYQCHGFHDSLPGGKSSGFLTLDGPGLAYKVGELSGNLPFTHMKFALGGASNRLVFITHPQAPDLTLYTSDLSILKNPFLLAHPECAPQIGRAKQQRHENWLTFAAIAIVILAIPALLLWKMEYLSGYVAKQVPVTWETTLGESVAAQYRITHDLKGSEPFKY